MSNVSQEIIETGTSNATFGTGMADTFLMRSRVDEVAAFSMEQVVSAIIFLGLGVGIYFGIMKIVNNTKTKSNVAGEIGGAQYE